MQSGRDFSSVRDFVGLLSCLFVYRVLLLSHQALGQQGLCLYLWTVSPQIPEQWACRENSVKTGSMNESPFPNDFYEELYKRFPPPLPLASSTGLSELGSFIPPGLCTAITSVSCTLLCGCLLRFQLRCHSSSKSFHNSPSLG